MSVSRDTVLSRTRLKPSSPPHLREAHFLLGNRTATCVVSAEFSAPLTGRNYDSRAGGRERYCKQALSGHRAGTADGGAEIRCERPLLEAAGELSLRAARRTVASLAVAALLAALVVLPSFWTFRQMKEAAAARKFAYEVLSRAKSVMSDLSDAETGQRDYLLTGDEVFLAPTLAVRESVRGHLEELRRLASISAARKHMDALAPLVDAELVEMSQLVELRRNHGAAGVQAAVGSGQDKRLMDSIRAEMSGFIQIEEGALAQHDARFQANMRYLFAIIVAASVAMPLFALSFAYLISRESQHRLKTLVHLETQHLLAGQEETNRQLRRANATLQVSEEKLAVTLRLHRRRRDRHRCRRACDASESACRTAHRLDAGGSRRSPGGRDRSHHRPGHPSTLRVPGEGSLGAWHDAASGRPRRSDCPRRQRARYRRQLRADSRPRRQGGRCRPGLPRRHRGKRGAAGLARQRRDDPDDSQYRGGRHHHAPCQRRHRRHGQPGCREDVRLCRRGAHRTKPQSAHA